MPAPAPAPARRPSPLRQLFPDPLDDVDPSAAYLDDPRPARADGPWVALGMVSSLDGGTALDGRSGRLGGPGDRQVFFALRSCADVILVGAGTARTEHYGPPDLPDPVQAQRTARGLAALPRIALVSARLDFDLDTPLFTDTPTRLLVVTSRRADQGRREAVAEFAEVLLAGEVHVDLTEALRLLAERRASTVVCEGGPSLNGSLFEADLVDEVCLTVAPKVLSGGSARLVKGPALLIPAEFELARILTDGEDVFFRYVRRPRPDPQ